MRPPPSEQELSLTPKHMTETPEVPETQVGGGGTEPSNSDGVSPLSIPWHSRTVRHSNAERVHLPLAAVREARNLQNFFPFPRREEEKETLEPEEGADDDELRREDFTEVCWEGYFKD